MSSIASFLSIESIFSSTTLLAFALSLKTLASAVFSFKAERLIKILGLRNSFLYSQLFGCASLCVLYYGFKESNVILTMCGIMLNSLPGVLVAILLTIIIRTNSANDNCYRGLSAKREIIAAVVLLIASICAPLLLWCYNLNYALAIDFVSYSLGLLLLINFKLNLNNTIEPKQTQTINNNQKIEIFKSSHTWTFILQTIASLALIGLIPMIASSSKLPLAANLNDHLREFLWISEAITALLASTIYFYIKNKINSEIFKCSLMLSSIFLFCFSINSSIYTLLIFCTIISLITSLSFMKFRDDYVLSAKNNGIYVIHYSSFSFFQKNIMSFISPLVISVFYTHFNRYYGNLIFIFIQLFTIFLYIIYTNIFTTNAAYIQ